MVFDIKEIESRLDPTLPTLHGVKAIDYISKKYATHNHYKLVVDLSRTSFFKRSTKKVTFPKEGYIELEPLRDKLYEYNALLSKKLTKKTLFQVLDLLVNHLCERGPNDEGAFWRYNANHWVDKERTLEWLEYSLDLCNQINKYKSDPETNGILVNTWNNKFTQALWACVYGGLTEEGLYIIQTVEDLIRKIKDNKPKSCVFKGVLDQPTYGRFMMSLYFAKAQIYLQLNELDKAEAAFEFIARLYRGKYDSEFEVYWTTGLNRVTEAAIEVYKLNPTEENKQRAIDYYQSTCFTDLLEPTETVRERGLITYMFMKYVLDIEVK